MSPIVAYRRTASRLLFALAAVGFITASFGATLLFGFSRDDYTTLYYIQHGLSLPYPYFFDPIRLWPLYRLFGLTSDAYFVTAIILFTAATAFVYWLARLLYEKHMIAATACVFFIFSLVGSGSMYSVTEAIRHTTYFIAQLSTLCFFASYQKTGKRFRYIFSVFLFAATVLLFPYRGYILIAILFLLHIFYPSKNRPLQQTFLLFFPFFILFLLAYFFVPNLSGLKNMRPLSLTSMIGNINSTGLLNILLSFLFVFLPTPNALFPLRTWLPALRVFSVVFTLVAVLLAFFVRNGRENRAVRFSFSVIMLTLFGFLLYTTEYQITAERYPMTIRPFYALFVSGLFYQAITSLKSSQSGQRLVSRLVVISIILIFVFQGIEHFRYQLQQIRYFGPFGKNAIATVRRSIPVLPEYTIVFLDAETNELRDQFSSAFRVGILPAGASLAVYYHSPYENIEITDFVHCDDFRAVLNRWREKHITVYYFVARSHGIQTGNPDKAYWRCKIDRTQYPTR